MIFQPRGATMVAVMGAFVLLGSCAGGRGGPDLADYDYRHRHPIVVEQALASLAIELPPEVSAIAAVDVERLERFAADYHRRGQGAVDVFVTGPTQATASEAARALAAALARVGLEGDRVRIGVDGGATTERATAVLTFGQPVARLPQCGDWSSRADLNYANTASANFGCSTQRNIGQMVADPRDLDRARYREAGEAVRSVDVVNRYWRGEATPTAGKVEATTMGETQ
ncbi:MAG: CpaD family pilus assembly lipoprotein [Rhodospirillales bacterium]|nr:CpaD family pilus assembly lipoprotein [Rhodospirillales bacterium]